MFFKKATKIDEIFTVDLTLCSKHQINGEYFVNFCGLLRKYELVNNKNHAPKLIFFNGKKFRKVRTIFAIEN